jgi:ubiquinone/menaquinone biosynthesis C-methylase UbiE
MTQKERDAEVNPGEEPLFNAVIQQSDTIIGLSPFISVDGDSHPQELIHFLDTVANTLTYKPIAYRILQRGIDKGDSILDAGCGSGFDFVPLSNMVGQTGKVIGVDSSEQMLAEAHKHSQELGLSVVQLYHTDIHTLPFHDSTFDGCRVDRVLQHVEKPIQVLGELTRVLKPNGIIVASEPDWDAWSIYPNGEMTKKIIDFKRERNIRNGHIAQELPYLLEQLGFEAIQAIPVMDTIRDFDQFKEFTYMDKFLTMMQSAGVITKQAAQSWLNLLKQSFQEGIFLALIQRQFSVAIKESDLFRCRRMHKSRH